MILLEGTKTTLSVRGTALHRGKMVIFAKKITIFVKILEESGIGLATVQKCHFFDTFLTPKNVASVCRRGRVTMSKYQRSEAGVRTSSKPE